jgi:aspartyl-tRNA(Asn)/glutamyl-tRNA(Gln) amidotransferase subunit C
MELRPSFLRKPEALPSLFFVAPATRRHWLGSAMANLAYARILHLNLKELGKAMKISREDVLKVAALANLELSHEEVDTYRSHLDDILTYIDKLNEIDTSGVEPLTQVVAASTDDSSLREDVIVRADIITEVLQGAPDPEVPYFRVPRVIEK